MSLRDWRSSEEDMSIDGYSYLQKYLVFADIKQLNTEVEQNVHYEKLVKAFPTVDKLIIRAILLAVRGDLAPAFNALLSLTGEDIQLGLPMRRYEFLPDKTLMEQALRAKQEDMLEQLSQLQEPSSKAKSAGSETKEKSVPTGDGVSTEAMTGEAQSEPQMMENNAEDPKDITDKGLISDTKSEEANISVVEPQVENGKSVNPFELLQDE
ncbi:CUE domain profile [Nakaseomyces glabratus]|nr:CUE domain profile [Nakaseomyces glabratus]KAH7580280.1 CUE domain profile [Nakaseomyces glabratus]